MQKSTRLNNDSYIKNLINELALDLDLSQEVTIRYRHFKSVKLMGKCAPAWNRVYYIYMARHLVPETVDYIDTLAHEMRHVWQFENKLLRFEGPDYFWRGKRHSLYGTDLREYKFEPDAIRYAKKFTQTYFSNKNN